MPVGAPMGHVNYSSIQPMPCEKKTRHTLHSERCLCGSEGEQHNRCRAAVQQVRHLVKHALRRQYGQFTRIESVFPGHD